MRKSNRVRSDYCQIDLDSPPSQYRIVRKHLKLSQEKLALQANVSVGSIFEVEHENGNATMAIRLKVLIALENQIKQRN